MIGEFHVTLPLKGGALRLDYQEGVLSVKTDKAGGTLVMGETRHTLVPEEVFRIETSSQAKDAVL